MAEEVKTQKSYGSAFDLLGKSYELVKANWQVFGLVSILTLISALFNTFSIWADKETTTSSNAYFTESLTGFDASVIAGIGIFAFVIWIIGVYLYLLSVVLQLRTAQGKKHTFGELANDANKYVLRLIGLSIVCAILIVVGFILFIIPGIFAIGRLAMSAYLLVDRDLGVFEAIKQSSEFAKGRMMPVYAAVGVVILVGFLSGLVSSIPVVGPIPAALITIAFSVVLALRYQQMKKAPATV
jgi:uncharacterized membrane protein